ncbi:penicillin acylase family protein [Fulvivirga ulvae]|uniref:penicillin acylase family protein n=1 Tax=Fulvivirga ulvae TaxID=2904245 RepID=UPI001F332398|nr:penicillin acylase family protein [Fulvivirga ulvae]UII29806.1 penicillin acylase family protein [Fulvivirga ulvae]
MKVIKYIFGVLATIAVLIAVFLLFYVNYQKPEYQGEYEFEGLEKTVRVHFDTYGTPHIYARNNLDAYRALGYVHAQDRLWQMELMRRIASGRLAEIFGKKLLETDKFFRTVGIHEYSKKNVAELRERKARILPLAEAYLEGVNEFLIEGKTPVEFTLLGIDKIPFTLEDIYNITGYMSFSFANAQKTDPVVTEFAGMGTSYLKAFDLDPTVSSEKIKSYSRGSDYIAIAEHVNDVLNQMPLMPFIGSNSWVLSPEKSETGRVVLSNDPHIGFSQPAVWYEAHLSTPDVNYFGYHIAGVPFAFLIHNDLVANGLTMFENDDMDFYRERVNKEKSSQYWVIDHWEDFEVRKEYISIKDSADVEIEVRSTRHGPVINDVVDGVSKDEPIAMWWVYYQFPNHLLDAAHEMAIAKNINDMRAAGSKIHAPGLNLMYGDAKGNIAWWAVGKLPKRPAHVNSKTILDGATGKDDPLGYYSFEANPQAENPSWGYVYSANNQSVMNIKGRTVLYPGYYLPDTRAARIVEVLESERRMSRSELKALFMDSKYMGIQSLKELLVSELIQSDLSETEREALEQFSAWNGYHDKETLGAAIFYPWVINIYELAMKDNLKKNFGDRGDKLFTSFMSTYLMKRSIPVFISSVHSPWWDDAFTEDEIEDRKDIITAAFKETINYLSGRFGAKPDSWTWGQVHTLEHTHPLGAVKLLRSVFNVGPYHLGGSEMVVNNLGFPYNEEKLFNTSFGPSTRRIIDFSDIDNSESILPTGQSGVPFSNHYNDQAQMYIEGKWRPLYLSEEKIKANSTVLVLRPKK